MNIIKIETRGAAQPRARAFIYVMHDCRRHEFVIIFTFYNRHSIQIQPLKLLVICYIGENNLVCKFRKKSTLLLCSTVYARVNNKFSMIHLMLVQILSSMCTVIGSTLYYRNSIIITSPFWHSWLVRGTNNDFVPQSSVM